MMFGLNVKNVKVNFAMNVENLIMASVGVLMHNANNYINIYNKSNFNQHNESFKHISDV